MGGLALSAAIVCITLPETHNQPTMEDLFQRGALQQGEGHEAQATVLWERAKAFKSCIQTEEIITVEDLKSFLVEWISKKCIWDLTVNNAVSPGCREDV